MAKHGTGFGDFFRAEWRNGSDNSSERLAGVLRGPGGKQNRAGAGNRRIPFTYHREENREGEYRKLKAAAHHYILQ